MTICHRCKFDLRDVKTTALHLVTDPAEIEFQVHLQHVLKQQWTMVPDSGPVYSHLYFEGLYHIVKMLFAGKKAEKVRDAIIRYFELNPAIRLEIKRRIPILSKFNVTERRALLQIIRPLLEDWPYGFIEFCRAHEYATRTLYPKATSSSEVPYWYWKVTHENFDRTAYKITDLEFASAMAYLNRTGQKPKRVEVREYFGDQAYERMGPKQPKQIDTAPRKCAYCLATDKQRKVGVNKSGLQSFRCLRCQRNYTPGARPVIRYTESTRRDATQMYLQGIGCSEIARVLTVPRKTIAKWIKRSLREKGNKVQ